MSAENESRRLIVSALQLASERYGRPVRGSKFKLLLRELQPQFDERALGHVNLRSFLAQFPDVVTVVHDGFDIVPQPVSPSDATVPEPCALEHTGEVSVAKMKRIRPDVWRAFTFVDPATARYYDREGGRAVMIGLQQAEHEPESTQALRHSIASAPDRFISISPISSSEHLAVMREFVERVPDKEQRDALNSALSSTLWFRAFMNALRSDFEPNWKMYWTERVLTRIEAWMRENQVSIPDLVQHVAWRPGRPGTFAHAAPRHPAPRSPVPRLPVPAGGAPPRMGDFPHREHLKNPLGLRQRILNAVGRMPLTELLRLPIPAEYYLFNDND